MPSLWPGGWWRLRDVVEQKKIAGWALLDIVARHKETVLRNAYLKGKRQTERGAQGRPTAYVVPANQHDPLTAVKMVNTLMLSDIEVKQARRAFTIGNAAGDSAIKCCYAACGSATVMTRTGVLEAGDTNTSGLASDDVRLPFDKKTSLSVTLPRLRSAESVADDASGLKFSVQRKFGIETAKTIHLAWALPRRQLSLSNPGSNSTTYRD